MKETKQPPGSRMAGRTEAQIAAQAAHDARHREQVATRNTIAARLMRLSCERRGGCTRACRRQKRCVVADAVEREIETG